MEKQEGKVREFNMPNGNIFSRARYIFSFVGAGSVLMSAAMGPGTLSSMLSAGSKYGYMLLWVVILSGIMNGVVAYIGGKIACLTGQNVYEFIAEKYGKIFAGILLSIVLTTWCLVIFSQGAAMLQIVRFFVGTNGPISIIAFLVVEFLAGYTFTKGNVSVNKIASIMVTLVSIMFLINIFFIKPDAAEIASGLVPKLPPLSEAVIIAGIIGGSAPGTSAAWYSFGVKKEGWTNPKNLRFIAWDQFYFALLFTIFSVGAFISAAAVLHPQGLILSSTLDAAGALEPVAGAIAKWVFALGFFGALFTTVGGMCHLLGEGVNTLIDITKKEEPSSVESTKARSIVPFMWAGIVISSLGGLFVRGSVMSILVNFLGLLNVGGFVIILILTIHTSSKKFAGNYVNKPITVILSSIIVLFNLYAVVTYIERLIKLF